MNTARATPRDASSRGVILFLSYDPGVPSFRYRLQPAIARLQEIGYDCVTEPLPSGNYFRRFATLRPLLQRARLVVVAKANLTPPEPSLLSRWSRRLAFDFDDAIYLRRPRAPGLPPGDSWWRRFKFSRTCAAMDLVIAGNRTLAEAARPHAPHVEIVPTPVDVARYRIGGPEPGRVPTVVWVGRPENLDYLDMLRPTFVRLTRRWPQLTLRILCSRFPDWQDVSIDRVVWSPERETESLATADIGIMPLTDDAWTRGKCAFKLLQYAAAGLPCVASDVGANREAVIDGKTGFLVRADADWERSLAALLDSAELRAAFGRAGREHVAAQFDAAVVSRRTAGLLAGLAAD